MQPSGVVRELEGSKANPQRLAAKIKETNQEGGDSRLIRI